MVGGVHPHSVPIGSTWVPRWRQDTPGRQHKGRKTALKILDRVDRPAGTHYVVETVTPQERQLRRLVHFEHLIRQYKLPDVVAVVNADGDRIAIWHVVLSPSYPMSRLSGAWEHASAGLVATRLILPFGGQMPDALTHLASASPGVIDVSATLAAVSEWLDKLVTLHESSRNARGKSRAPIKWPALPAPLDWTSPPSPPAGVVDDPFIASTIGVARWVADLADAWAAIETKRRSREHLAAGNTQPRPLPVVLVKAMPA
jgi:hypothetical protein